MRRGADTGNTLRGVELIDWADVRRRVTDLGRVPAAAEVFGSLGHRFELEPVLRPHELAELESQLNVALPADYREFLLNVGRGGAGPGYGVFPLRRTEGRWHWVGDGAELTDLTRLDEPFPVRGPDRAVLDALLAEEPEEEDYAEIEAFDAAYEAWDDRHTAVLWDEARTVGALCICHLGCALRQWLVASGPERGNVWSDDRADGEDLMPSAESGSRSSRDDPDRLTFSRWYLAWLEAAEATARS
jgi:SMI1 / KNR4 family (SUKH-1)